THDMSVAEKLCDFVFMIYRGRKVLVGTLEAVLGAHGSDTLRVRLEGLTGPLTGLPGVARVTEMGRWHELRLEPGADAQQLLPLLAGRGRVCHFELTRPSLHDVFVRIAGPEASVPTSEEGPDA